MSSQIGQDSWVLDKIKGPGFFVDIGAYDGITDSNTLRLERAGWKGICVEPLPDVFDTLQRVRTSKCFREAVHDRSGGVARFRVDRLNSGLEEHLPLAFESWPVIAVPTISLNDLLGQGDAPRSIEYISLDTEGSEIQILSTFDFDRWDVHCWTVEHNDYRYGHSERSKELVRLFSSLGYKTMLIEQDVWCSRE